MCSTPQLFRDLGFSRLPFVIDTDHLGYMLYGTYKKGESGAEVERRRRNHMYTEDNVRKLPDILSKPIAVITSESRESDSIVAIIALQSVNGTDAIVPIQINGVARLNGDKYDVYDVTSMYGKEETERMLRDALRDDTPDNARVLYWNEKRWNEYKEKIKGTVVPMPRPRVESPSSTTQDGSFMRSIKDKGSPVKRVFVGATNTRQFENWNKRNVLHKPDGTPMVFHEITGIDLDQDKLMSGFYFENTDGKGSGYYLRMRNPLYLKNRDAAELYWSRRIEGYDRMDEVSRRQVVADYIKTSRFDGVIIEADEYANGSRTYIVLDEKQAKSTENEATYFEDDPHRLQSQRVPYRLSDTEVLSQADRIKGENQQENEVLARYRQEQENVRQLRGEMDSAGDRPDSAIATGKGEACPQGERALSLYRPVCICRACREKTHPQ